MYRALLLATAACGRLGFAPTTDATSNSATDGRNDDGGDGEDSAAAFSMTYATMADTFIVTSSMMNSNNATQLAIGHTAGGAEQIALLRFALSVPNGLTVTSASLAVVQVSSMGTGTIVVEPHAIISTWDSATVNYASRPNWDGQAEPWTTVNLQTSEVATFDLTAAVQAWHSGTLANFGIALMSPTSMNGYFVQIASAETSVAAATPVLHVVAN